MLASTHLVGFAVAADVSWTPASLPNLQFWVRADLGITIGTGVSTWADQSLNGRNLTQGTGAQQPTVASADINGKDAVKFLASSSQSMVTAGFALSAPVHIFAVLKSTDTSATRFWNTRVTSADGLTGRPTSAANFAFGENNVVTNTNFNSSYAFWECLANGASSSVIKNAGTAATGTTSDTFAGLNLGSYFTTTLPANVWFAEFIVCNTAAVSGSDLTSLRSYMTGRYGFP